MPVYNNKIIYENLKELNIIDEKKLTEVFNECERTKSDLAKILLSRDLIEDENLGKIIAGLFNVPFIKLNTVSIPTDILHIVPELVAKKQRLIAFKKDAVGLHVAFNDPDNLQIAQFLEKKTGSPIVKYYATQKDVDDAFSLYAKNVGHAFDEIIAENVKNAKGKKESDPPIIKIVDTILTYANQNKASDIHVEPLEDATLVRFRIDGVLHDVVRLPLFLHESIVTRVKVLSKLRTDEHASAQDGKFQFGEEKLDIRVSIVPIVSGEKIVLRLLSEKSRSFSLSDLGATPDNLEKIKRAYAKPYGMLLSTGPTGCGKTTTMYAILKLLNMRDINIMTIEDPVEYDIEGINQIQVNQKTNLTFAAGLKSILRQDPNVILVGEIRDAETAGIAVNSAMTGHLVLSTLHTNDASTAIPRLLDMGIEPFLLASSVNVIIAQRLVRKICMVCRTSYEKNLSEMRNTIPKEVLHKIFGKTAKARLYQGKGCSVCHETGYVGRIGIFEILEINEKVRAAIVDKNDAAIIKQTAVECGMQPMLEDGLEKVKNGITTLDEILRVTKS